MVRLKLVWTATAIKQRNYVFEYWNKRNGSTRYSKKLNINIKERIVLLKTHPKLGKKTELSNTRVISLGHYSILYKKIDLNIIITGFWDNRQDPKKLISFLKKN
ncbi:MAG: type II toxin-antitoxin system RelE/ParE family toxin [Bacteroidetes bacterium]|nr:type II toxin-antitoxin system RelE/ParE family toxin [Bacteroidota bacterium]MBL6943187.1 type II toxin-antitoxin system RelE/ParE family toxin [Bacteroidales bacterium]